ncbi:hypothetical protein BT63DRAFT_370134, partial [Microthyrium microscopicum]
MRFFQPRAAIWAFSVAHTVLGHAGIHGIYINGQDQGKDVCVRMNQDGNHWNEPVENLSSSDMACGVTGTKGVNRVCPVPDGATITFEWGESPDKFNARVIDISHVGPCTVYMKKVDSAISDTAAGDGWFKIFDEGYDEATQKWCVNKLIDNGGYLSAPIPKGLVGGSYLVRAELLALQNAIHGDPQYYIGCAQIFLNSSGNKIPAKTVAIPGIVSKTDVSDSFNVYDRPLKLPYPVPGPAVAELVNNGKASQAKQTEGVKPAGCICESGSAFCGVEVPEYSSGDEAGCWASSQNCWDQNQKCYDNNPPTGVQSCQAWMGKCNAINADCKAKRAGPANRGQDITP